MTRSVFVFLGEGAGRIQCALAVDGGRVETLDHTSGDFAKHAGGSLVAVLAGEDVSTWAIELPALSENKLLQILPAQLEDNKAIVSGDDHCAILSKMDDGKRLVACVSTEVMDRGLQTMNALGLTPELMVPDYLLLKHSDTDAVAAAYADKNRFIVRLSDGSGFAGNKSLVSHVVSHAEITAFDLSSIDEVGLNACNLLQGRYRPRLAITAYIPLLRRTAALAAAVIVLFAGSVFFSASQNNTEADALGQQSLNLFRETFPEITRIVDVQAQASRAVARVRAAEGSAFLKISEIIFLQTKSDESAIIEGIRFNEPQNAFFLTISFASFSESDQFLRQLRSNGLQVTEGSSRQDDGRVITDIAIEVQP